MKIIFDGLETVRFQLEEKGKNFEVGSMPKSMPEYSPNSNIMLTFAALID